MVERGLYTARVAGSIPVPPTKAQGCRRFARAPAHWTCDSRRPNPRRWPLTERRYRALDRQQSAACSHCPQFEQVGASGWTLRRPGLTGSREVRIQLAPEAVDDLTAAIEYLHERNPRAAVAMSAAVFDAIEKLAASAFEGPERHRPHPDRICPMCRPAWGSGWRCCRAWPAPVVRGRPEECGQRGRWRVRHRRRADSSLRERRGLRLPRRIATPPAPPAPASVNARGSPPGSRNRFRRAAGFDGVLDPRERRVRRRPD